MRLCVYSKYSVHHPSGLGCPGLDTVYLRYCTSPPQALQEKGKLPFGIATLYLGYTRLAVKLIYAEEHRYTKRVSLLYSFLNEF